MNGTKMNYGELEFGFCIYDLVIPYKFSRLSILQMNCMRLHETLHVNASSNFSNVFSSCSNLGMVLVAPQLGSPAGFAHTSHKDKTNSRGQVAGLPWAVCAAQNLQTRTHTWALHPSLDVNPWIASAVPSSKERPRHSCGAGVGAARCLSGF